MRRHARPGVRPAPDGLARRICSILLSYPDQRVYSQLDDIATALAEFPALAGREHLAAALEWLRGRWPQAAAAHYVATFDLRRRCCPYLTYYRYGDTRKRGMALLALNYRYRRHGYEPAGDELPDYLPAVLEFASLAPQAGGKLLAEHRAGLELLRRALADLESPYAAVLDAVHAGLPALSDRQVAELHRLAADGPPTENVGLDPVGTAPFGPPEFVTGLEREQAR
jgi:nitrate reductase delta subunit